MRQLRVGIDVSRPVRTAGGTLVEPFGEVHARHDGGSGQTGAGLEVAGGLRMALRHDRYADRLGETYLPGARPSLRVQDRRPPPVEIVDHDRHLSRLTTQTSPTLREGFGIGADTAAERLIIFGDTPDRIMLKPPSPSVAGPAPSRLRPG